MEMYVIILEISVIVTLLEFSATSQAASVFQLYLNFVNMPQWIMTALIKVITFHQFAIIV